MTFEYRQNAPVFFGPGAVEVLGEQVKALGCKKALCVYDAGGEASGGVDKAIKSLEAAGIACVRFNRVKPDAPMEIIDEGGELGFKEKVDCIVGIGGGSSLDSAKAIAILMSHPGPIKQYILAKPIAVKTEVPVICVATTSGTGSEVTHVAIVNRTDLNAKWSVFVTPTLAIVDPELTLTLPKRETANTGLDALSHAAECLTCTIASPHSDLHALAAIKKIADNLYTCWSEPGNLAARSEMALASNWAGIAFDESMCHVGHSLADGLSCAFHTPHGYNCALALPEALNLVAPVMPEKLKLIAEAMGLPLKGGETGEELGKLVADGIRKLMRSMEVKSLKELGFDRARVLACANEVAESHLSRFCPVDITPQVAETLLARIYDNY
ncbi:MAG: iron-containing alcohol dehydrogenase [Papillibacter sp.]|jgi:1,3-propanediol dehydrogenase|nr:iron-containing alcohol dehydrogenase [Papillibacter sp.]